VLRAGLGHKKGIANPLNKRLRAKRAIFLYLKKIKIK
jgi:hypothetical protein